MIISAHWETAQRSSVKAALGGSGWDGHWDMVMGRTGQRFLVHLAFSAAAAIVTPAMAAGLVAGASAGTQAIGSAIYPSENDGGAATDADSSPQVATHAPAKLSLLAGNGKEAWESVRAVRVDFRRHPK
jgi:hypothetical protein